MGGLDSFCQIKNSVNITADSDPEAEAALLRLKATFRMIIVIISSVGVAGNVLNLVTLRSPSLRNVPFMFIRALALFDLISLGSILLHFLLETLKIKSDPVIFYEVWVEDVVINSFLVAGLYCAVLLTIERFLLIRKPLSMGRRLFSIENTVLVKIGMALLAALLLHLPLTLQWQANCAEYGRVSSAESSSALEMGDDVFPAIVDDDDVDGPSSAMTGAPGYNHGRLERACLRWARGKFNNRALLCRHPFFDLYNYYKMGRELLRFFCVLLLIILNAVIARHLQMAKRKRRMLIKRTSMAAASACSDSNGHPATKHGHQSNVKASHSPPADRPSTATAVASTAPSNNSRRDQLNTLIRSFTEKKLTALMIAICVIFAIGNIPQMVVMALQNDSLNSSFSFQVFRQVANTLEVLNHCLNFFIFCMASSEYCRAFLSLSPLRWLLRHSPLFASLARARLNGRLDTSHHLIGCAAAHESASDCLHAQRKKSSAGTVLASSENGGFYGSAGNCPPGVQGQLHRYRRDWSNKSTAAGSQRGGGRRSQHSLGSGGAVIIERRTSSTLLTNGVASGCLDWPPGAGQTVQLIGGRGSNTTTDDTESAGSGGLCGDDEFL